MSLAQFGSHAFTGTFAAVEDRLPVHGRAGRDVLGFQGQAEGLPIHKSTPRHRSQLQHTAHYHVNLTYGIRLKSTDHALNATFINHLHLKQ